MGHQLDDHRAVIAVGPFTEAPPSTDGSFPSMSPARAVVDVEGSVLLPVHEERRVRLPAVRDTQVRVVGADQPELVLQLPQ